MAKRNDETLYALPELGEQKTKGAKQIRDLLQEAHECKKHVKRLAEIKMMLVPLLERDNLASEAGLGARVGNYAVLATYTNGRKSLSKELLIENGVEPYVIEASMKPGKPGWRIELPEIGAVNDDPEY